MSEETIHEVVRNRYASIVKASDAAKNVEQTIGCCGPAVTTNTTNANMLNVIASDSTSCCSDSGCGVSSGIYNSEMLEGLPVDVTGISLGCGDPISIASLNPGEIVLDLGSGGGIDCFLAAKRVGSQGKVIGVDMTPEMLERANTNKEKMAIQNVEFRQGQIEALPVDDNSVDVVMSNCVINLSPDKRAVFGEAYRVLKSGGRVSISDIVTEGSFNEELRSQVDKWAECVTGAIDVNEYTGMMCAVGFIDIQVVDKTSAEQVIPVQPGMPRIYSARITAKKA